jgi:signal transduction histidine kinase
MLQQLLMNLILNAFNAMPDGGTLDVVLDREGDFALIKVGDTGRGIPPDDLNKLFVPFYTTNPVGKGTGLGLSLCYSIVKQHFGAIEVESHEGKGTTFTLKFPLS